MVGNDSANRPSGADGSAEVDPTVVPFPSSAWSWPEAVTAQTTGAPASAGSAAATSTPVTGEARPGTGLQASVHVVPLCGFDRRWPLLSFVPTTMSPPG